jgi:hypothetical protein
MARPDALTVWDASQHADHARRLLGGVRQLADELEHMSEERRLELAAMGQFKRLNADLQFTTELATAHALTALALTLAPKAEVVD